MGRTFNSERAEMEANKIGLEFAHSNDVVKDMSRAYNVDFSNIKVHTDSAADSKVKAAGKDALAQGNDIFFGKGIFESSDPADKGLVAHEFAHTMQQGAAMGGEMAVAESAPMGVAQGGIGNWFREHFTKEGRDRRKARKDADALEWVIRVVEEERAREDANLFENTNSQPEEELVREGSGNNWFKSHFTHKGRVARRAAKTPMQSFGSGIFSGEVQVPEMAAGAQHVRSVSHEEFQEGLEELRRLGYYKE